MSELHAVVGSLSYPRAVRSVAGVLVIAGLFAACGPKGSGSTAGGTVTGSVGGQTMFVADVGGLTTTGPVQGQVSAIAEVFLTNEAGACGWISRYNSTRSNLTTLSLLVQRTGQQPAPIAPGTYSIGGQSDPNGGFLSAQAEFVSSDATCSSNGTSGAQQGTITFTTLNDTTLAGSFDLTFQNYRSGGQPSIDHISGSFSGTQCKQAFTSPEGGLACHP